MYSNTFWETGYTNKNDACLSELFILLSHCFEKKGNTVIAGLLYNKANITINRYDGGYRDSVFYRNIAYFDRAANPADIDTLLALKHKKNKTPFEQILSPRLWGSDDQYNDLKGTILFASTNTRKHLLCLKA